MINPSAFAHIEAEALKAEERATRAGGEAWQSFSTDIQKQELFLETFQKTFSIKHSLKAADVAQSAYSRWRSASIYFVKMFNEVIELWHDDIYTSAAVKARGWYKRDETSDSGYVEDAEGMPIYFGADTKIMSMFLKVMHPEFKDKLELDGGLNNTSTPLDKDAYKQVREDMLKNDDC